MLAAVHLAPFAVLVEGHQPSAHSASDLARQQVLPLGPPLDPAPGGGREHLRRDERFVVAGEPLAVHLHFAQIDAGAQDADDGRVLDSGCCCDVTLARPITAHGEDAPYDGCHLVGDQLAVDQVETGLGPVDPLALAHSLMHAHAHVLGQLLPVELGERSQDVVEHPARRRREVDLLGE